MATVEQDTFTRPDTNTWNPASNGDSWTFPGVAETYSITSNKGLEGSLNGGDWHGILGAGVTATPNLLVRVKADSTSNFIGVFGRYTNASGVNGYRMGLFAGQIVADKFINGVRTNLGSSVSFSYDTSHYYWLHAIMNGSTLTCAAWVDGGSEPAPQYSITDNSVVGSGGVGLSGFMSAANNSYDSFLATDNQAGAINLAVECQTTFKIRTALATEARATFKIRAVLDAIAHTTFKIRSVLVARARATFKIKSTFLSSSATATIARSRDGKVNARGRDGKVTGRGH